MPEATKQCTVCGEAKPLSAFYRAKSGRFGRRSECKACAEASRRKRTGAAQRGPHPETGLRRCSICREVKPLTDFGGGVRRDRNVFEWESRCRTCNRKRRTAAYRKDPAKARAQATQARARALRRGRSAITATDAERFWTKVERRSPADCWPWLASKVPSGYGQFSIREHGYRAHRIAFELEERPLDRGESLSHLCGNRACCNPAHLELGYDGKGIAPEERFAKYAYEDSATGCWEWLGATTKDGPILKADGRTRLALRWAWEHDLGAVPRGLVVQRTCDNGLCVNPAHARLATPAEVAACRTREMSPLCSRGHLYPQSPPLTRDGARRCLPCEAMAAQRRRALLRAQFVEDVDPAVLHSRSEGRCGICEKSIEVKNVQVDHVIPLTRGGEHSYANTRPSHRSCNSWKGARLDSELDFPRSPPRPTRRTSCRCQSRCSQ
jgi:5-methylcytosine-specific restriction endonuclease McrA